MTVCGAENTSFRLRRSASRSRRKSSNLFLRRSAHLPGRDCRAPRRRTRRSCQPAAAPHRTRPLSTESSPASWSTRPPPPARASRTRSRDSLGPPAGPARRLIRAEPCLVQTKGRARKHPALVRYNQCPTLLRPGHAHIPGRITHPDIAELLHPFPLVGFGRVDVPGLVGLDAVRAVELSGHPAPTPEAVEVL